MNEPPVLRGKEAELNRAKRILSGTWTEADKALRSWLLIMSSDIRSEVAGFVPGFMQSVVYYKGEKVWPPE